MSLEDLQRPAMATVTFLQRNEEERRSFSDTGRTMTVKFQLMNHAGVEGAGVSALRKLEKRI